MAGISVHYDICTAMKVKLLTKTFPGLPSNSLTISMLPRVNEPIVSPLPQIILAPISNEAEFGMLLCTDDIGYPVAAVIVAASNMDFTTNMEQYLGWRQTIYRAFRNQRLDVPGAVVYRTYTYPDVVFDPEAFNMNYVYSGIIFRFVSREVRG